MLKRAFALSDQGAKDLAKGIIATACANLIQIIPASLLLMVVMMLLEKAAGTQVNVGRNIPFFVGITLVPFWHDRDCPISTIQFDIHCCI